MGDYNFYHVVIREPIEVPALVYETAIRAAQRPLTLLLSHEEVPHINRGRTQPIVDPLRGWEVRRPDGGNSWYHDGTVCYMHAHAIDPQQVRSLKASQAAWCESIIEKLVGAELFKPGELSHDHSDIFYGAGNSNKLKKHVAGTSGFTTTTPDGAAILMHRCCFYETPPKNIDSLLRFDGIDPSDFNRRMRNPTGFSQALSQQDDFVHRYACHFLSLQARAAAYELQHADMHGNTHSCVMGNDYLYAVPKRNGGESKSHGGSR